MGELESANPEWNEREQRAGDAGVCVCVGASKLCQEVEVTNFA